MNFKKTICAAAALAVAATALTVPASAATAKKLLTEPITTVGKDNLDIIATHSDNLYVTITDTGYVGELFSITSDDINKWRETGEFSYTDVSVDGELDYSHLGAFSDENMLFNRDGSSGNIVKRYAYDFNGSDTLSIRSTYDNWVTMTDDGYAIQDTVQPDKLTINITNPDGSVSNPSIALAVDPKNESKPAYYSINCFINNSDFICAVLYADKIEIDSTDPSCDDVYISLNLALVKKDGTVEKVWNDTMQTFTHILGADGDYVVFAASPKAFQENKVYAYNTSTGEMIKTNFYDPSIRLTYSDGTETDYDNKVYTLTSIDSVYGNKAVAYYTYNYNGEFNEAYALVEFTEGAYAPISGDYKYMETNDGEIYLVKTADDKWGYINSDCELLKAFDDAGTFAGKYAPVVNNGQAYLINKNMKRVSEKIGAEGVSTIANGLYAVTIDGEKYFMTYADADETAAEEPTDETTSTDTADTSNATDTPDADNTTSTSGTSTAIDTDKTNPDTGAGSVAFLAAAAVAAVGIAAVSRKRNH